MPFEHFAEGDDLEAPRIVGELDDAHPAARRRLHSRAEHDTRHPVGAAGIVPRRAPQLGEPRADETADLIPVNVEEMTAEIKSERELLVLQTLLLRPGSNVDRCSGSRRRGKLAEKADLVRHAASLLGALQRKANCRHQGGTVIADRVEGTGAYQ